MGSMMPLESCPPKTDASMGTATIPVPCTPVFDIPMSNATRAIARTSGQEREKLKRVIKNLGLGENREFSSPRGLGKNYKLITRDELFSGAFNKEDFADKIVINGVHRGKGRLFLRCQGKVNES